ncbi:MAG: TonB-dependent receptor [Chitinophagales bacterium]
MKYLTLLYFSFNLVFLFAQAQISGVILDNKGAPIFGVNVSSDRMEGSVSDFDGKYLLKVAPGNLVLKLSAIGYESQEKNIAIQENESLTLNFTLKEDQVDVDDVVVYGSKRGKLLQEEIQSVEVIKADLLQNNNVTDGLGAVNLLSGVTVLDGQMSIRGGSGYAYGVGSRVILVQDEVPGLTPERDEINWDFIATENIEQIELLKGGGGVQYGSSALNGVLNVRSAWAKELGKPETELTFYSEVIGQPKIKIANWWKDENSYFETPHTLGATFTHRRKMKKNFDLTISGMGHSFQSHLKEEFNERTRFNVNFRHRPDKIEGLSYGLFSKYMFRNDSFFFLWKDNQEGKYKPLAVYGKRYHYAQFQPFVKYYDKKGNSFKYNGSVYYDSMADNNSDNSSVRVFNDLQYERKFNKIGLNVLTGLTIDNRRIFAPALRYEYFPNDVKGAFKFSNYAVYLMLDYKYKNLNLSGGGRYEMIGFEGKLNSSKPVFFIGANYKVTKNDFLRFSISQSFRLPNVAEKYVNESLGPINIYPNPEIQAETGYNAELAYKRMLNFDKFKGFFDFAFFWTEFENMVEFNFNDHSQPEDTIAKLGFKAENVARARIFGWEINLEEKYQHKDFELAAKLGYTYAYGVDLNANQRNKNIATFLGNAFAGVAVTKTQHTRFEKNTLSYQPKNPLYGILKYRFRHTLKVDLSAKYKRFGLGLNMAYYSYMDNVDEIFLLYIEGAGADRKALNFKGSVVLNIRAMYEVKDKVMFSFIIKNVTNNDYAIRPAKPNAIRTYTFQTKFLF